MNRTQNYPALSMAYIGYYVQWLAEGRGKPVRVGCVGTDARFGGKACSEGKALHIMSMYMQP